MTIDSDIFVKNCIFSDVTFSVIPVHRVLGSVVRSFPTKNKNVYISFYQCNVILNWIKLLDYYSLGIVSFQSNIITILLAFNGSYIVIKSVFN
jgi:hypothetical protein